MRNVLPPLSAFLLMCAGLWGAGFRVNVTDSMPVGIYRIVSGAPERGDYVRFCSGSETAGLALARGYLRPGYCPSGARPLLKSLAGIAGDAVRVTPEGIYVNDVLQPASVALARDKNGLPLAGAALEERVPSGRALLLAEHRGSYDSRYFGYVPLENLRKVREVVLWRQ